MDWKDIASAVGRAATVIGTLLGGPAGGGSRRLGGRCPHTQNAPDAVSTALTSDPDALLKL